MEQEATGELDRSWAEHAVGGADTASLLALATADPSQLNGAALVDAITASEKALSLLTGIQLRLLAAFSEPFVAGDPMRLAGRLARRNRMHTDPTPEQIQDLVPDAAISLAGAEVAAALRISPVTAGLRVREAITMTTSLAPTLESLEHGIVDRGKARVIAEHCEPLTPEHTAAVQDMVLPAAGNLTTSELRDFTGQAVITIDPHGADERHQASAARRSLAIKALPDAMATLSAFLPADGAVKIFQVSDLLATSTAASPGDNRGIAARRVDALVDIAEQLLTYGHLDLSEYLGQPLADSTVLRERSERPADDESDQDRDDHGSDVSNPAVNETVCPADGVGADTSGSTNNRNESTCPKGGANPEPPAYPSDSDPADTKPAAPFEPGPAGVRIGVINSVDPVDPNAMDLNKSELLENPTGVTDFSAPVATESSAPVGTDFSAPVATESSAPVGTDSSAPVATESSAPVGSDTDAPVVTHVDMPVGTNNAALDGADPFAPVGPDTAAPIGTDSSAQVGAITADSSDSSACDGSVDLAEVIDRRETVGDDDCAVEATPPGAQVEVTPASVAVARPDRLVNPDTARCSCDVRGTSPSVDQTRLPARERQRASGTFTRQGRRPHLSVTLGLGTLAGFDNLPGKLEGFGAIPAGLARSIAISAATIATQLVDAETGIATHAGSLTYRPRQELRDQVATLNGTCRFPSCRQPVWRCDLDHREPFDHADPTAGGPTSSDNLDPYCRRHHLMKHHTDWRVRPDRDSYALHFTSPTGHRYTKQQSPAAPHSVWMDNPGSAFADRLENVLATTKTESSQQSTGVIEELLTAALLRHHLRPRPLEYVPDNEFWANTDGDAIDNPLGHGHAIEADINVAGAADRTVELSPVDDDGNNPEADDEPPPPF